MRSGRAGRGMRSRRSRRGRTQQERRSIAGDRRAAQHAPTHHKLEKENRAEGVQRRACTIDVRSGHSDRSEDDAIELALSGWVGDMADDLAVYPRYAPGLSSVLCPPCLSGTQRSSRRACI